MSLNVQHLGMLNNLHFLLCCFMQNDAQANSLLEEQEPILHVLDVRSSEQFVSTSQNSILLPSNRIQIVITPGQCKTGEEEYGKGTHEYRGSVTNDRSLTQVTRHQAGDDLEDEVHHCRGTTTSDNMPTTTAKRKARAGHKDSDHRDTKLPNRYITPVRRKAGDYSNHDDAHHHQGVSDVRWRTLESYRG